MALWLAITFALAFAVTNGFHDAANAIATLVATRGRTARRRRSRSPPSSTCSAPLLVGTAVADTIAGIVTVSPAEAIAVIGAGVLAATLWNSLTWWRGLPSSSGHALVGGLVGAALVEGGIDAVNWGGLDGWRPVGVFGVLIALAVSPVIGARRRLRRSSRARSARAAPRDPRGPRRCGRGEWVMSAAPSFSHGANDAQKAMGVIAALLVADGRSAARSRAAVGQGRLRRGADRSGRRSAAGGSCGRSAGGSSACAPIDALASQTSSTGVDPRRVVRSARRCRRPRSSPRRSSASAAAAGAGATCAGGSCARSASRGSDAAGAAALVGALTDLVWGAVA